MAFFELPRASSCAYVRRIALLGPRIAVKIKPMTENVAKIYINEIARITFEQGVTLYYRAN